MPVAPTARAPQPTSIDRRELRAIPDGKTFPWHRPASTATIFGCFPIAKTFLIARTFPIAEADVAGPSPVPCQTDRYQRRYRQPVPADHAEKKITQM
jgi:hypothetical protein